MSTSESAKTAKMFRFTFTYVAEGESQEETRTMTLESMSKHGQEISDLNNTVVRVAKPGQPRCASFWPGGPPPCMNG